MSYIYMEHLFLMFLDHTQWRSTVGRAPLDEWSAHRRDLYLTTHNTHNRQTSMPPVGFEPTISAGERPQTYAIDRAATGTGTVHIYYTISVRAYVSDSGDKWTSELEWNRSYHYLQLFVECELLSHQIVPSSLAFFIKHVTQDPHPGNVVSLMSTFVCVR